MCRSNSDGTIEEKILTDDEFSKYLDVGSTAVDYVKLELLYSQVHVPYNTNIGMDDQCNVCLMAGNGYTPKPINQKSRTIQLNSKKPKWKIIHTNNSMGRNTCTRGNTKSYGPKLGIETIYNAMNPYKQNCISEIELVNALV